MDLWTAFGLGLVGSLHCVGMCGPLALALPVPAGGKASFIAGRLMYHAGRLITYGGLGLVAGWVGKSMVVIGLQNWVSIALGVLLLAGLIFSRPLSRMLPVALGVQRLKHWMSSWLQRRSMLSLGVLGLLNGLLPCGLVYAAFAGAAAAGTLEAAVGYMVVFGLGTVPLMFVMTVSGKLLRAPFRTVLVRAVPAAVVLLAALLILRGLSLGIPYVSPDLGTSGKACCHTPAPAQP